jgi:uncharacterized repeat protein (TIGR03803 family)
MKTKRVVITAGVALMFGWGTGMALPTYQMLHSFAGGVTEASTPVCTLLASNGWLFGTAPAGGISNAGVVFTMRLDGTGYTNLHHFVGGDTDGDTPTSGLVASGVQPRLFGLATGGGISNAGVVFSLNMDGTGYTNLHHFVGGPLDGETPRGGLTLEGTRLYGTALYGGTSDVGIIFALNTDGTGFTNLHSFTGPDGFLPSSTLALQGNRLYGMAAFGGSSGSGTAFALNTDGSGFVTLHSFAGGDDDGQMPQGALAVNATNLFGLTLWGGVSNAGVVFSMHLDGGGYTNLHSFRGAPLDGDLPMGTPLLVGPRLFGLTDGGGLSNGGTLFGMRLDGGGYTNLHHFTGGVSDGLGPQGSLLVAGARLYGVTSTGGAADEGTAFALNITDPQLFYQNSTGLLASWILDTNGAFQAARLLGPVGGWLLKAAGDVDGDGVADLLFQTAAGDTGGWFMNVSGTTRDARSWWATGNWQLRACADYDADGLGEVFFQRPDGMAALWHLDASGTFQSAELLGSTGAWQLKTAGDLDLDRKAEVFWQQSDGTTVIWFHNPDGSIRAQLLGNTGEWELRCACDVDFDGVADLGWQTPDSRTGGWFMNTNGTARSAGFWWATGDWQLKAAGR